MDSKNDHPDSYRDIRFKKIKLWKINFQMT